ncbi:MMPL family transporter [Demequina mangrovi]|uniref:Putative drug exporter of the RND superfamily n=1 Tax=Demequina mangrovi TaxID=1043493 RepID=A0A1H6WV48_9MICO|nr:MMPL family transporter [Demequina mangrovi]SEJ18187.1 putative drug exporter of the RND superfamily [Demequina mangrovi]
MELGITGRIARTAAARPWITITVWLLAIVAAVVAAGGLGDALTQDDRMLVATESDAAADRSEELRAGDQSTIDETVVITAESAQWGDVEFTDAVDRVVAGLEGLPGVRSVTAPSAEEPYPVSEDGRTALVTAVVDADSDTVGEAVSAATDEAEAAGFTLHNVGDTTAEVIFDSLAEDTLVRGEMIGIAVALVILVIVFGALVAAGLPLMVALVSITTAVGATAIVGQVFELSFFIVNMITMMGLALGIDYSLVAVQRFREELAHGRTVKDAVAITGSTANRAILFSGVTVLISLVGMLVVPSTIMRSLGAGAMIVAVMAVITALTLLPAVLRLLGHRVNRGRIPTAHPGREPRVWSAIARSVVARPAVFAAGGLAVLLALSVPLLSIRLTFPGLDALPEDNDVRQGMEVLVDDFGYGQSSTLVAIDDAGGSASAVEGLASAIEADPAFAETTVDWHGTTAFIDTRDVFDSADPAAEEALDRLRADLVPAALDSTEATANVGGGQAEAVDFADVMLDSVPLVLAIVLGASFLLLLIAFRSIAIPLTAIALNVVSAAAAFGLLVGVFQFGWGSDLLGFAQVDGIAPWIPLFLFAVLFGLSMDYHVFLISRIKERYDSTGDTKDAVVFGLSRTGSLITGAALIMVAVFLGFSLGDLAEFQQMGFGLAAAVIIDATIVRTILVPSLMTLLGERNWTLPRWLGWLPQVSVEGRASEPPREKELVGV